jgi:hypothetical protein
MTRSRRNRRKIVGGILALSASLAFAFNNYFIKKFKMDFADVLLVRATCQILIFGLFSKLGGYRFYPDFSSDEEPRKWKIIKSFLLILQVNTRYSML